MKNYIGNKKSVVKFLWMPKMIGWKIKWLVNASWEEEYMWVLVVDGWYSEYTVRDWVPIKWN